MAASSIPIPGMRGSTKTQTVTPPKSPPYTDTGIDSTRPHSVLSTSNAGPMSPSSYDSDLSSKCRRLAASWGHDAVSEFLHEKSPQLPPVSLSAPRHSPSNSFSNPALPSIVTSGGGMSPISGSVSTFVHSPLSPRAGLPPTPEGGFLLEEISEEKEEDDTAAKGAATLPLPPQTAPTIITDDEQSDDGSMGSRSRRSSYNYHHRRESSGSKHHRSPVKSVLNQGSNNAVADVFFVDGELLVGSELSTVSADDTLSALYLEPLLSIFGPPDDAIASVARSRRSTLTPYHHISSSSPFYLILNFQTTAKSVAFQYLLHALSSLRDNDLLTSYCPNSNILTPSLITVICTGDNTPWEDIMALTPRYVFAEIPWKLVGQGMEEKNARELTPLVAVSLTEAGWDGVSNPTDEQRDIVKRYIDQAHQKGLKIRFTEVPRWPKHARELVRTILQDELSADFV